jgi:hypothetical protein
MSQAPVDGKPHKEAASHANKNINYRSSIEKIRGLMRYIIFLCFSK